MRDPYAVLGVSRVASSSEIKSAYRRQAKASHPDSARARMPSDIPFSEILAAYEILGDAEKRRLFDEGVIDAAGRRIPRRSVFRGFAASMSGFGFPRRADGSEARPQQEQPASDDRSDSFKKASHDEIMERIFGEFGTRSVHEDAPAMDDPPRR